MATLYRSVLVLHVHPAWETLRGSPPQKKNVQTSGSNSSKSFEAEL